MTLIDGEEGLPPHIPPNAKLTFDLTLLGFRQRSQWVSMDYPLVQFSSLITFSSGEASVARYRNQWISPSFRHEVFIRISAEGRNGQKRYSYLFLVDVTERWRCRSCDWQINHKIDLDAANNDVIICIWCIFVLQNIWWVTTRL